MNALPSSMPSRDRIASHFIRSTQFYGLVHSTTALLNPSDPASPRSHLGNRQRSRNPDSAAGQIHQAKSAYWHLCPRL